MEHTKISIIVPYKEDRGYLERALNSIYKQSYKNYEILLSHSDNSVGYNLNRGIEKATGDLIRYLCDDDMLSEDSLLNTVNNFGDADFIHSKALHFWEDGRRHVHIPSPLNPSLKEMLMVNRINGGSVVYHSRCFEGGLFDESLTCGEEYDFNLMLISKGHQLKYIPEFTYLYRRHNEQKSLGNMDQEYQAARTKQIQMIKARYNV